MISTVVPSFQFGMHHQGEAVAKVTCPASVDSGKLEDISFKNIVLLLHQDTDVPYSFCVSLDGKLCLKCL